MGKTGLFLLPSEANVHQSPRSPIGFCPGALHPLSPPSAAVNFLFFQSSLFLSIGLFWSKKNKHGLKSDDKAAIRTEHQVFLGETHPQPQRKSQFMVHRDHIKLGRFHEQSPDGQTALKVSQIPTQNWLNVLRKRCFCAHTVSQKSAEVSKVTETVQA